MSGAELAAWGAFERVHGPVLVHDRVDIGLAMVAYTVAATSGRSKRKPEFRHFLPPWLRDLTADDAVRRGIEKLASLAGRDA